MINSRVLFIVTIISVCLLAFGIDLDENDGYIYWHKEKSLEFSDFQAEPDTNSPYGAISAVQFEYSLKQTHLEALTFKLRCYFDKNKSWFNKPYNEFLLSHEQTHFNMAETYVRKIIKELSNLKVDNKDSAYSSISKIYKKNLRMYAIESNKYDSETNFSRIRPAQLRWNNKIDSILRFTEHPEALIIKFDAR